jgi:hypothetical protein
MLRFFSNCWGLLDNSVNTPFPVVLPVLCLVCHGILNNYSIDNVPVMSCDSLSFSGSAQTFKLL